jgi:hypothetical protein
LDGDRLAFVEPIRALAADETSTANPEDGKEHGAWKEHGA